MLNGPPSFLFFSPTSRPIRKSSDCGTATSYGRRGAVARTPQIVARATTREEKKSRINLTALLRFGMIFFLTSRINISIIILVVTGRCRVLALPFVCLTFLFFWQQRSLALPSIQTQIAPADNPATLSSFPSRLSLIGFDLGCSVVELVKGNRQSQRLRRSASKVYRCTDGG